MEQLYREMITNIGEDIAERDWLTHLKEHLSQLSF